MTVAKASEMLASNLTNEILYGFSYPLSSVSKLIDDFDGNDAEYSIIKWMEEKRSALSMMLMRDRVILGEWPNMITIVGVEEGQEFIEILDSSDSVDNIREQIRDLGLRINGLPRLFITSSFGQ